MVRSPKREMIRMSVLAAAALLAMGVSCGRPAAEPRGSSASEAIAPIGIVTDSGVEMIWLPGGEFTMGSDRGRPEEAPAHRVRVGAFLMDRCEVTHAMFASVQLPDPSRWQDDARKPVERVRWREAKQYCNERSRLEGLAPCYDETAPGWPCDAGAGGYRLPTEAEWEYACRAGESGGPASPDRLRSLAWFDANSDGTTHPVGRRKPNAWGFHDLLGNVAEWCEDAFDPGYYRSSPTEDPCGPTVPAAGAPRVIRGGHWKAGMERSRPAARAGERTGDSDACFASDYCGFRCVRRVTSEQLRQLQNRRG